LLILETARFDGPSDAIQLDFVKRVATPIPVMKLAIHLPLVGLSLRKTVIFLEKFGVKRSRSIVHYWVKKSNFEPASGRVPEKIALDETVVRIDGDHHWLFAAVDP